jgi:hypothetical protein
VSRLDTSYLRFFVNLFYWTGALVRCVAIYNLQIALNFSQRRTLQISLSRYHLQIALNFSQRRTLQISKVRRYHLQIALNLSQRRTLQISLAIYNL